MLRTHTTSGLPPPLEEKLRQLLLRLLPIAVVAVLMAWVFQGTGASSDKTARIGLPLVAALFTALWGLLIARRVPLYQAELSLVGFPALYMVANEVECMLNGSLYRLGDPIGWLWMPVIYLLIFLLLPQAQARTFSWVFLGAQALVYLAGLPRYSATSSQLHYGIQYFVSSTIVVCVLGLYSELKQRFGLIQSQAETDALTGLINRRQMQALLEQAVAAPESFSILLLDIDHFKHINDKHGHNRGDDVLREVSVYIGHCLRQHDLLSRWGGEEFILLLPNTDLESALGIADRVLDTIRTSQFTDGISLTVSIGAALYLPGERPEDIVQRADIALYQAKHSGRDRVILNTVSRPAA